MIHHQKIIIVGAGPAGIGLAILLKKLGFTSYLMLEGDEIGSTFRRWPREMRFITPSFTGQGFGALDLNAVTPGTSPAYTFRKEHLNGDEYADYLELLADHFDLKVKEKTMVTAVSKKGRLFTVETDSDTWTCEALFWATGEFQFPRATGIEGAHHGLHVGHVDSYEALAKAHYVVVGGGESGADAAFHLARNGSQVTVVTETSMNDKVADPSLTLSPYTYERMEVAIQSGRVSFKENRKVTKIAQHHAGYDVELDNGEVLQTTGQPILATGFASGATQIASLFEWQENGKPLVTEEADESTVTEGLFLIGPSVQHRSAVFCFIYKFRARYAAVVKQLFTRWGYDMKEEVLAEYENNQMLLEDLACCEVNCEC
ncbi:NAD(P)/FAD-dependent oxidoreductase [Halalkalibacter oceani]|uniref:NAD(P)-binding domain-containing protein n=1 Tax=Halalkalibacter oceani TaxID=1653776 RepID=A0A9X2DN40_9BACI|nr:NAD(P)/FAD-dependent oxidoreductase [Halalkalibacter oceani]MCM3713921.1 NAD(P)-binding domain-containing protein [Halalkalibacter oceani]